MGWLRKEDVTVEVGAGDGEASQLLPGGGSLSVGAPGGYAVD